MEETNQLIYPFEVVGVLLYEYLLVEQGIVLIFHQSMDRKCANMRKKRRKKTVQLTSAWYIFTVPNDFTTMIWLNNVLYNTTHKSSPSRVSILSDGLYNHNKTMINKEGKGDK